MENIAKSLRHQLSILKSGWHIMLLLTLLAAIFASISIQPYTQISWCSTFLTICLVISLFGADERNRNTASSISGRYIFVILSYLVWFVVIFATAQILAATLGNPLPLGSSIIVYFAQSVLSFSIIVAFQLTISYKKGSRSVMWVLIPILLLNLLSMLTLQSPFIQTIIIGILAHQFLVAAILLATSCFIWLASYHISLKICQPTRNNGYN